MELKLKLNENSENLTGELGDKIINNLQFFNKDEQFPMPWNAYIEIGKNKKDIKMVSLIGSARPSGYGECTVSIPINGFNDSIDISLDIDETSDNFVLSIIKLLKNSNWTIII